MTPPNKQNERPANTETFDSTTNDPTNYSSQIPIDLTRRTFLTQKLAMNDVKPKESIWGKPNQTYDRVVGLGDAARLSDESKTPNQTSERSIDEKEQEARKKAMSNSCRISISSFIASIKVFGIYLITLSTIVSTSLSVGLTCYWYFERSSDEGFNGSGMDWILLGFAVITPLTTIIGISFKRRERALLR